MSVYEVYYADAYGSHAEALEAWDDQDAVHQFRADHRGEQVVLVDVVRIGETEEMYA